MEEFRKMESNFVAECWVGPSRAVLRFSPNPNVGGSAQPASAPQHQHEVSSPAPAPPEPTRPQRGHQYAAGPPIDRERKRNIESHVAAPSPPVAPMTTQYLLPEPAPQTMVDHSGMPDHPVDSGAGKTFSPPTAPHVPPCGFGGPTGWHGERSMLRQQLKQVRKAVKSKHQLVREHAEEGKRLRLALCDDGNHHAGRIRLDSNGKMQNVNPESEQLRGELRKLRKDLDMERRLQREFQDMLREEQKLSSELRAENKKHAAENKRMSSENNTIKHKLDQQAKMMADLQERLTKSEHRRNYLELNQAVPNPAAVAQQPLQKPAAGTSPPVISSRPSSGDKPAEDEFADDFEQYSTDNEKAEVATDAEVLAGNKSRTWSGTQDLEHCSANSRDQFPIDVVLRQDEKQDCTPILIPRSAFGTSASWQSRAPASRPSSSGRRRPSFTLDSMDSQLVAPDWRCIYPTTRVWPGDDMSLRRSLSLPNLSASSSDV